MMFSKRVFLCIGIATWAMAVALSAPLEQPESCVARLEERLAGVLVPKELDKIIDGLREINVRPPQLKEFSLNKLLDSALAELRFVEVGIISRKQADDLVELCADYVGRQIHPAFEDTCDLQQFLHNDESYMKYLDAMQEHSALDRKIGAARICMMI